MVAKKYGLRGIRLYSSFKTRGRGEGCLLGRDSDAMFSFWKLQPAETSGPKKSQHTCWKAKGCQERGIRHFWTFVYTEVT